SQPEPAGSHAPEIGSVMLGLFLLLIILCFVALRLSWRRIHTAPLEHQAPTMQRPRAGRHGDPEADDDGIEIVTVPVSTLARNPTSRSLSLGPDDMPAAVASAAAPGQMAVLPQGTSLFTSQHPPLAFPTDSVTLALMQSSPEQWTFLDPGFAFPELHLLLSPLVACDPDFKSVTLFADNQMGAPKRIQSTARPRALSVQTRLPVPIPPLLNDDDGSDIEPDGQHRDNMEAAHPSLRVASNLYFEVRIKALGVVVDKTPAKPDNNDLAAAALDQPIVAVGLAHGPFPPFRLPGWSKWSVGYHSHMGQLFLGANSSSGYQYGDTYGAGDVVGVGIDTVTRCVFFTLNGDRLPIAVELPVGSEAVFPTVGATGPCTVEYNFGTRPFFNAGLRVTDRVEFVGYAIDVLPAYEA
ncbi:hypothetical protein BCR44DRAFT_1423932, partial [Catenaria anguillulae PL171]